jgi:hypothetical protein
MRFGHFNWSFRRGRAQRLRVLFVSIFLATTFLPLYAAGGLTIRVLEGDGALNSIALKRAKEPIVRVEDAMGMPLSGVVVNFILPLNGAGAFFGGQEQSLTVTSDDQGLAGGRGLKPNRIAGTFQIRVTASAGGEVAVTQIEQTNVESAATGPRRGKMIAIAVLIGGGAVGGLIAATHGGHTSASSPVPPPPTATVISAGNPSFGPPPQ